MTRESGDTNLKKLNKATRARDQDMEGALYQLKEFDKGLQGLARQLEVFAQATQVIPDDHLPQAQATERTVEDSDNSTGEFELFQDAVGDTADTTT